jgi:DNA-binding transcriptional regulator/RsmH inhibitor MraZ
MVLPTDLRNEIDRWAKDRAPDERSLVLCAPGEALWLLFPDDFAALRAELDAGKARMTRAWLDAGHALGMVHQVVPDGNGRLPIPAIFREEADIGQDVAILVVQGRVELWNPERWKARRRVAQKRLMGPEPGE